MHLSRARNHLNGPCVCVCVWGGGGGGGGLLPLGFTGGGEGPSDPPTGLGMLRGPGRRPCRREATCVHLSRARNTECITH